MNKSSVNVFILLLLTMALAAPSIAADNVLFSFEQEAEGWEIPEWALEKQDCVGREVGVSKDFAKEGKSSLKLEADFPGKVWTAAIVEVAESFDFTPYTDISCDIYLPKEAPLGLKAKIIFTVGDNWKWVEMARSVVLTPGEWVNVTASFAPGSTNWQRTIVDENFRKDIRKIDIRVESNKKPVYNGPIYIDNIKVTAK